MGSKYVQFLLLLAMFGAGVGTGYAMRAQRVEKAPQVSVECPTQPSVVQADVAATPQSAPVALGENIDRVNLKLDLLKDYLNFVWLPKEKIPDPNAFVAGMKDKVLAINEVPLIEKYNATGEQKADWKEKLLEFFTFLIDDIKKDLK